MNYDSATIDAAHVDGGPVHTVDLEGLTLSDLCEKLHELFPPADPIEADADGEDPDDIPARVKLTNPQGFAVHLFEANAQSHYRDHVDPVPNFDDLCGPWSDAWKDDDRREAMGDYLENLGGSPDLSDFDEAYQGKHDSGAAFAEEYANQVGAVDEKSASWICIDWEQTWERSLRHDYWISDNGHVFRNL